MASSSVFSGRLSGFFAIAVCFILTFATANISDKHRLSPETWEKAVKVAELPPPNSGLLGLSPFIQPVKQFNVLFFHYPHTSWNPFKDHFAFWGFSEISFRVTQPTKRIAVHGNCDWDLKAYKVTREESTQDLPVKEILFNPSDDTFYVDMVDSLGINITYKLHISLKTAIIDETARFGIQVFNRTHEDTGDDVITISLSSAPKAMRRLLPCFDDPSYAIPYTWHVDPDFGLYPPAIVVMHGPKAGVEHYCTFADPTSKHSRYFFVFPPMAIEATQLRIVPYLWYPEVGVPAPPKECY